MKDKILSSILASPAFTTYSLRSVFFTRKLMELGFLEIISEVRRLLEVANSFKWAKRKEWGITESAWKKLKKYKVDPLLFFLHPRIIDEQPTLVLYYRGLSLLSQKGFRAISGTSVVSLETGSKSGLNEGRKKKIYLTINNVLSVIIENVTELGAEQLKAMLYATAGTQIQGAWNNAVGAEGEIAIRKVILTSLYKEIKQIVLKSDKSFTFKRGDLKDVLYIIDDIKILRLAGGFSIVFGQEPDVSLRDADNVPIIAAEIKAGSDPAGALERLGASMKSFENGRSLNPRLKTIYVANCITDKVRKRISQTKPFDYTFDFSDILTDDDSRKRFANLFLSPILRKK